MSSWAGATAGANDNDLTDVHCRHPLCTSRVEQQFVREHIHLCREHALFVWAKVQAMVDEYGAPEPKPVPTYGVPDTEFVYFIATGGRIKIGYTKDLDRRLSQYPPDMEVLLVILGDRDDERRYHHRFAQYLRDGREWFEDCAAVREAIAGLDVQPVPYVPRRRAENVTDLVVVHRN